MAKHMNAGPTPSGKKICRSGLVVTAALLCVFAGMWLYVFSTGFVPGMYLAVGCVLSFLLCGVVFFLTWEVSHKIRRIVGYILAAVLAIACLLGGLALWRAVHTVRQITNTEVERSTVAFYVEQDAGYESLNELEGNELGILSELDRSSSDETLKQTETEYGIRFETKEYASLTQLADALREGEVACIVLNQAFLPLYEETPGYEEFPAELREISVQEVEHSITGTTAEQPDAEADSEEISIENPVVTVLISGSDTRGNVIDQRGRSDVNIIARINRETHEILLVSTPRDYYVPLALSGNPYDKLTHAGIYGMDVLMGTLENLYDTGIDYYFRINFTGFTEIIDALGGIQVTSDYDFSVGQFEYHQGINTLNGEEALAFARERYSFTEGDRQRGKNQMAVIEGVLQKAMSPSILTGYLDILESVQDCVDTSVPYDLIAELVRQQLSENASWNIESFSVDGSDSSAYTYSMAQKLYVMQPDETTVQTAKDKLAALAE